MIKSPRRQVPIILEEQIVTVRSIQNTPPQILARQNAEYDATVARRVPTTIVLPVVVVLGSRELQFHLQRHALDALAPEVNQPSPCVVVNPPTGGRETAAPIDVVAVHELAFVEQTDLVDRLLPDHHAGAR